MTEEEAEPDRSRDRARHEGRYRTGHVYQVGRAWEPAFRPLYDDLVKKAGQA